MKAADKKSEPVEGESFLMAESKTDDPDVGRPDDARIHIDRPAYTQGSMAKDFRLEWDREPGIRARLRRSAGEACSCTAACWTDRLLRLFPFVGVMRAYQWRRWLVLDLISGLSVGVIHIPQGMGFSLLASLPPVYGLYSSLYPVVIYFFFGTSRHISVGTMALISLMIGRVVIRELDGIPPPEPTGNGTGALENVTAAHRAYLDEVSVGTAMSVSLLIGCTQVFMGLVGLGAIATFMSMPFIGGFLCAAALHILTSQIPSVFGVAVPKHSGLFRIPLTFHDVGRRLGSANVCALITAAVSLLALVVVKNVVNVRFRSRLKAPIPAELIVVAVATLVCRYCRLAERYGMRVVGPIPAGLPAPRLPPMAGVGRYVGDAAVAAVVSFVVSVSMAKLMAKRHGYAIDVNQELYAYGISHAVGSLFGSFAGAQAPPRTLVHESVGGKTQLGSLVSSLMVLLVCLFLGQLFYSLPVPVLAAVIIVALLPMFGQFGQLPTLWRVNKYDFFVWLLTFASGVVFDVTTGLVVGMGVSVFFVVLQAHFASASVLVALGDSGIYLDRDRLRSGLTADRSGGVVVVRFDAALYFVNVERFKTQLFQKITVPDLAEPPDVPDSIVLDVVSPEVDTTGEDVAVENDAGADEPLTADGSSRKSDANTSLADGVARPAKRDTSGAWISTRAVILDCSAVSYVDIMGVNTLRAVADDLRRSHIRFSLACLQDSMATKLRAAGVIPPSGDVDKAVDMITVYPTVPDAVTMETNVI